MGNIQFEDDTISPTVANYSSSGHACFNLKVTQYFFLVMPIIHNYNVFIFFNITIPIYDDACVQVVSRYMFLIFYR